MKHPDFVRQVGADTDPQKGKDIEHALPMRKLCEPGEAANFVATLIDGKGTCQTSQLSPSTVAGASCEVHRLVCAVLLRISSLNPTQRKAV